MTIIELKATLQENPRRSIRFVLPDQHVIPGHFHITEVGHVRKEFIDCGGTRRQSASCVLQAWVATDRGHALEAGKLASILHLAGEVLPTGNLPVEVECNAPYISQFPIASATSEGDAVVFHLAAKHTDCLAREQCGLDDAPGCRPGGPCCTPEGNCC